MLILTNRFYTAYKSDRHRHTKQTRSTPPSLVIVKLGQWPFDFPPVDEPFEEPPSVFVNSREVELHTRVGSVRESSLFHHHPFFFDSQHRMTHQSRKEYKYLNSHWYGLLFSPTPPYNNSTEGAASGGAILFFQALFSSSPSLAAPASRAHPTVLNSSTLMPDWPCCSAWMGAPT